MEYSKAAWKLEEMSQIIYHRKSLDKTFVHQMKKMFGKFITNLETVQIFAKENEIYLINSHIS